MVEEGDSAAIATEEAAPADPLVRLLDSGRLAEVLTGISDNGWRVKGGSAEVLQASRSRPVVRYLVNYVDHGRKTTMEKIVIGKGYYRGDGTRTYDVMQELWANGFADDPDLRIAEPVAWIPDLQVMLQGQAPGHALYDHINEPGGALAEVTATGRWLAKLHATSAVKIALLPGDHEVRKLSTYCSELSGTHPRWADRIATLTASVLRSLDGTGPVPTVPTHGDYQPKNIYVAGDRITVIDWDRVALAHPGRDLGHFLAQSMTMSFSRTGSFDAIAGWNEAFLDGYRRHCAVDVEDVLPAYIARTFLEILYYKLVVKPVKDPAFVPLWLDECERWIGEERAA